jgi:hypothetical protein
MMAPGMGEVEEEERKSNKNQSQSDGRMLNGNKKRIKLHTKK